MNDLQPLKSDRSLLVQILESAGCIVKGPQVRCAFHNSNGSTGPEKHSSGSIFHKNNAWLYRCHGCNDCGDVFHWIARGNNKTDAEVLEHLNSTGELLGVGRVEAKPTPPPKEKTIPYDAFASEVDVQTHNADNKWLSQVSQELGVTTNSLKLFRVGKHEFIDDNEAFPCISVPMYNCQLRICGIRYRAISGGKKKSRYLSRNGIFLPTPTPFRSVLWVTEGCTDPIALTSIGLWSIGLPAASQGIDAVDAYCQRYAPQAVVAVSDNNRAGKASSTLLCRSLIGMIPNVKAILPPDGFSDVRGWIKARRESGWKDKEMSTVLLSCVSSSKPMKPKTVVKLPMGDNDEAGIRAGQNDK